MKNILICTIIRNGEQLMDNWIKQIAKLSLLLNKEYIFYLSVYENDSTDKTPEILNNISNGLGNKDYCIITSEILKTKKYESVWSVERMQNLVNARQKCIDQAADKWGLKIFDKIAYIEIDVIFDPNWCAELILAEHPRLAGIEKPDIYSGWSLRTSMHPKESIFLYDTCTTRQARTHNCWNFEKEKNWRKKSLIKTHVNHYDSNCLHSVWSTFNCFCVYNSEPFIKGVRWDYLNKRLDTGQEKLENGWLDADTSVICENFRMLKYNKIFINTNCLIRHV